MLVSQILLLSEHAPSCGSPEQLESARVGKQPGSQSGLGLQRRLAPRHSLSPSLPPSQPASRGARSRAPSPCRRAPPPTSREQETRGPEEGDQVGEAMLGEGAMQPAAVYLTAAADASDALLAQPAPRILRLGVIWDQGTHKTTGVCEPPWGSRKKSCLASSVYAAPLSTETTGPRQPQSRYTSKS